MALLTGVTIDTGSLKSKAYYTSHRNVQYVGNDSNGIPASLFIPGMVDRNPEIMHQQVVRAYSANSSSIKLIGQNDEYFQMSVVEGVLDCRFSPHLLDVEKDISSVTNNGWVPKKIAAAGILYLLACDNNIHSVIGEWYQSNKSDSELLKLAGKSFIGKEIYLPLIGLVPRTLLAKKDTTRIQFV
ncbi:MAG: hypothetical protein WCJ19_05305 [bacterium]